MGKFSNQAARVYNAEHRTERDTSRRPPEGTSLSPKNEVEESKDDAVADVCTACVERTGESYYR